MNRHQLADAMIKGLKTPNVIESQTAYIAPSRRRGEGGKSILFCHACAMGCAVIGHYEGDVMQAREAWKEATRHRAEYDAFADLLGVEPKLAVEVEFRHMNGQSIALIAAWLKSSES